MWVFEQVLAWAQIDNVPTVPENPKLTAKQEIQVDLDRLRASIASGELKHVNIVEHEQVLEAIDNFDIHPAVKRKVRNFAIKDQEILVKGVIPSRFIQSRGL